MYHVILYKSPSCIYLYLPSFWTWTTIILFCCYFWTSIPSTTWLIQSNHPEWSSGLCVNTSLLLIFQVCLLYFLINYFWCFLFPRFQPPSNDIDRWDLSLASTNHACFYSPQCYSHHPAEARPSWIDSYPNCCTASSSDPSSCKLESLAHPGQWSEAWAVPIWLLWCSP